MKLLHISDLHFGYDRDQTMKIQRDNLLDELLRIDAIKQIDMVAITGDMAWQCKVSGYNEAEQWISKLKTAIGKDVPLINCCGNHDVCHEECIELDYINNQDKIDDVLRIERLEHLQRRFQRYENFCKNIGSVQLSLGDKRNYLIGSADINDIRFWCFNSAWYAINGGKEDKAHLWLGRNFFDFLDREKRTNSPRIVLSMMHHPKEWLNENEMQTNSGSKSLFELISQNSDLMLTGHTHGNIQEPNTYHNHMLSFSVGATYADNKYKNNFSIFDLNTDSIVRIPYCSVNQREWQQHGSSTYKITDSQTVEQSVGSSIRHIDVGEYSKTKIFKDTLENVGANLIKVTEADFGVNKYVIWPVVPRNSLTVIHIAQLELMRILYHDFGWSILAIVSNCGANPMDPNEADEFIKKVVTYCNRIGIDKIEYRFLDSYFKERDPISSKILECFVNVSSKTNMPELRDIKMKKYSAEKKEVISRLPVLDYILPVLQLSVIKALSTEFIEKSGKKPIIIAGNDEESQWNHAAYCIGGDKIGAILIPELNISADVNISQDVADEIIKEIVYCPSRLKLNESFTIGNTGSWMYRMLFALSNYDISDTNLLETGIITESANDFTKAWSGFEAAPSFINCERLKSYVWDKLEKGNIGE